MIKISEENRIVSVVKNEKMVELCGELIKEIASESKKYCESSERTQNFTEFIRVSDEILLSVIGNLIDMHTNAVKSFLEFVDKNFDELRKLSKKNLSKDEKNTIIKDMMKEM